MLHIASTLAPVSSTLDSYLPVVLIVVMAVGFGAFNLIATELIGPKVAGKVKMSSYESGMDPIGTARQRFHVRFYVLAMTFLLFDVEVVFLYPWAVAYTKVDPGSPEAGLYLGRVLFFVLTSIVAYVYACARASSALTDFSHQMAGETKFHDIFQGRCGCFGTVACSFVEST